MSTQVSGTRRYTIAALSFLFAACSQSSAEPGGNDTDPSAAPARAYTLGQVIASQGNEALREIRKEGTRIAQPELPKPDGALAGQPSTEAWAEPSGVEVARVRARLAVTTPRRSPTPLDGRGVN